MASSTPNRLLAMLNSVSNPNPNPNSSNPNLNQNSTPNQAPHPSGSASPREPTPVPPPPSVQAVSLQDLFKSIAPLPSRPLPTRPPGSGPAQVASPSAGSASGAGAGTTVPTLTPFVFGPSGPSGPGVTGVKSPPPPIVNSQTVPALPVSGPGSSGSAIGAGEGGGGGGAGGAGKGDQQNRLLGMLMNISAPRPGQPQPEAPITATAQPQASAQVQVSSQAPVQGQGQGSVGPANGVAADQGVGQGGYSFTESEAHRQVKSLLDGLRAGSPSGSATSSNRSTERTADPQSVSTKPTESPINPAPAAPKAATASSVNPANGKDAVDPAISAVLPPLPPTSLATSTAPPAIKSPFHFVSPFDAFGPPAARSVSSAAPIAPPAAGAGSAAAGHTRKVSASAVSGGAASVLGKRPGSALDKLMPAPPAPQPTSTPAAATVPVPEVKKPVGESSAKGDGKDVKPTKEELAAVDAKSASTPALVPAPASAASSVAGKANGAVKGGSRPATPAKKANGANGSKSDVQIAAAVPAPASAVSSATSGKDKEIKVFQPSSSGQGTGPKALGQHTTLDLSLPNLDALISDKDAITIIPAAILKSQPITGFQRGRSVAVTQGWMAYALSGGRIRLLDRDSGSRIVLQIPVAAATGPIRDLAVTPTTVAAIGSDGSVIVWRVPAQWNKDDPPCSQVLHIPAEGGDGAVLGELGRLEIIEKPDGGDKLAVCGEKGVLVFDINQSGGRAEVRDLAGKYKVMTTEGPTVGFCLNHTQQAIALISSTSYLTIYSVATSARVFHKPLPSTDISSPPTSVQFCETNLLIGRRANTLLELVQITTDIAVLGSITFKSSPADYCQALYDPARCVLWAASHLRGSLFGFQYTLKGRPPVGRGEEVVVFARMGEVGLDAKGVVSLGMAREGGDGAAEVIFAHERGVGMAVVGRGVVEGLKRSVGVEEAERAMKEGREDAVAAGEEGQAGVQVSAEEPGTAEQSVVEGEKVIADVREKGENPETVEVPVKTEKEDENIEQPQPPQPAEAGVKSAKVKKLLRHGVRRVLEPSVDAPPPHASAVVAPRAAEAAPEEEDDDEPVIVQRSDAKSLADETNRQMKKMEDRIVTQFRQALSAQIGGVNTRLEASGGEKMLGELVGRVEGGLRGVMGDLVRDEVQKNVLPSITSSIKTELSASLPNLMSSSVTDTLRQTLPKELERLVSPAVHQAINKAVQATFDKSVQDAVKKVVLPGLMSGLGKMFEGLAGELRGEMVQLRKDLAPLPVQPDKHAEQFKIMAESMVEVQRQIATLSEQVRSAPSGPPAPPAQTQAQAYQAPHPSHAPPPPAPQAGPPGQLEDLFISTLSIQTVSATLSLLNAHYHLTDYLLPLHSGVGPSPSAPSPSPLSQPVLLTLYHRLALALNELPRADPMVVRAVQWERRVAGLLDARSGETGNFYYTVTGVVREILEGLINKWGGGDGAARALREVLEVVASKA